MQVSQWLILAGVFVITMMGSFYVQKRFFHGGPNAAQRRWEWIGVPLTICWGATMTYVGRSIERDHFNDLLPPWIAIPAVCLLGVSLIWWMYMWLRKADEMIRRVEIEAMALGLGLCFVGFVTADQLGLTGKAFFKSMEPGTRVLMPFFMAYGLSRVIVYLRYR